MNGSRTMQIQYTSENIIHKSLTQFSYAHVQKKKRIAFSDDVSTTHRSLAGSSSPISTCTVGSIKFSLQTLARTVYSFKTHQNIIKSHLISFLLFPSQRIFFSLRIFFAIQFNVLEIRNLSEYIGIKHTVSVLRLPSKTMKVHIF